MYCLYKKNTHKHTLFAFNFLCVHTHVPDNIIIGTIRISMSIKYASEQAERTRKKIYQWRIQDLELGEGGAPGVPRQEARSERRGKGIRARKLVV